MNRIVLRHLDHFPESWFSVCIFRSSCTYNGVGRGLSKVINLVVPHAATFPNVLCPLGELICCPHDYISVCFAINLTKQLLF